MMNFNQHSLLINRRMLLKMAAALSASSFFGNVLGCDAKRPISVASHVWPGYEFMFLARSLGFIKPEDVTLYETNSASESLQALSENKVKAAALTLDEALRGLQMGIPLMVVLLFDVSVGADAVLARSNIKTISNLKGARVGVETTALGQLMLNKLLYRAGLNQGDIKVVQINIDKHWEAWQKGDIDALITYEPVSSKVERNGAVRLFDSSDIPNTIFDVLVVRRDKADSYQEQIKTLIRGHFKALSEWQTNPIDTGYRLIERLKTDINELPLLYRGLQLPDLIYNRHMLSLPASKLNNIALEIANIVGAPADIIPEGFFASAYLPDSLL